MMDALFTGRGAWFAFPAVLGTVLFLIRMGLLLIGGHGGHAGDMGHGGADAGHHDSNDGAPVLSFQSVTAFMMGFGWGGLAAYKTMPDLAMPWVILIGVGCGVAIAAVQVVLLRSALKLQASGNISIEQTIGAQGVVYVRVPGGNKGKGQVSLVVQGKQRMFNAITPGDELPAQTRVNVAGVNSDNTITVKKAE